MSNFVKVASTGDVAPGACKTVEANGKAIAVFNVEGTIYATDNTCPHRGGPLGEGELEGKVVTCPWHGWRWDVTTGASPVNPNAKVACYPCKVEGDQILVEC